MERAPWAARIVAIFSFALVGCADPGMPTPDQLAAFEKAGPARPLVDTNKLMRARAASGVYRVVSGDALELQMPQVLRAASSETPGGNVAPYSCRVDEDGMIHLPLLGPMKAAGQSLGEIEQAIVQAAHPKFLRERPSVVAKMAEYQSVAVSVLGAVKEPGIYRLHSDEKSLVALLMKAGGILPDGAGAIRIRRGDQDAQAEKLSLPVKGLNIPFADVPLKGGEVVEVEGNEPQVLAVLGLVNHPGVFPYPPEAKYTLTKALAFAGGVDELLAPRYAKVYRQDPQGQTVAVAFPIDDKHLAEASGVRLKPGDIVAIENTPQTDARRFLSRIGTGLGFGTSYSLNGR